MAAGRGCEETKIEEGVEIQREPHRGCVGMGLGCVCDSQSKKKTAQLVFIRKYARWHGRPSALVWVGGVGVV